MPIGDPLSKFKALYRPPIEKQASTPPPPLSKRDFLILSTLEKIEMFLNRASIMP